MWIQGALPPRDWSSKYNKVLLPAPWGCAQKSSPYPCPKESAELKNNSVVPTGRTALFRENVELVGGLLCMHMELPHPKKLWS